MIRWTGGGATWTIKGNSGEPGAAGSVAAGRRHGADRHIRDRDACAWSRSIPAPPARAAAAIGTAIDGMPLAPVHLWIEAQHHDPDARTLHHRADPHAQRRRGRAADGHRQHHPGDRRPAAADDYALQTTIGDSLAGPLHRAGAFAIHRLDASECILDDVTIAEDAPAWLRALQRHRAGQRAARALSLGDGPAARPLSRLPPLRRAGLRPAAPAGRHRDHRTRRPATPSWVAPQNGSEMGAFQREGVTLKKRGLVLKFEEYAPLGVYPGVDRGRLSGRRGREG